MAAEGVRLQERAFLGHIGLRCDPRDAALTSALERVLECALPRTPNMFAVASSALKVLWLGPDEWLSSRPDGAKPRCAGFAARAGDGFATVIELGSGQTVIEMFGVRAREIIAKGCPLDLHPRVFEAGCCAQSRLARTLVTIAQIDASPGTS